MATIRSLIVKIGGDATRLEEVLKTTVTKSTNLDQALAKVGASTEVGKKARQDLDSLGTTIDRVISQQKTFADAGVLAAKGIGQIGGPAKLMTAQLDQMSKTVKTSLDAFRALGQQAPAELTKVAAAIQKQQAALSGGAQGGLVSRLFGDVGAEIAKTAAGFVTGQALINGVSTAFHGLENAIKGSIEFASQLDDLSKATNIGVESLQELGFAGKRVGLDLAGIADLVSTLTKRIGGGDAGATAAVQGLGLNLKELKTLAPDRLFTVLAEAVSRISDPLLQASVGSQLFGKQFQAALKLANDGLDETRKQARDAGAVLGEDAVKKLDAFGDKVGDITTVLKVLTAEALTPVVVGLTKFLALADRSSKTTFFNKDLEQEVERERSAFAKANKEFEDFLATRAKQQKSQAGAPVPFGPNNPFGGPSVTITGEAAKALAAGGGVTSQADFIARRLIALRTAAVEPLTASQKANIASLSKWGESESEIPALVGASQQAVHQYIEELKKSDSAHQKFAASMLELDSASGGFGATLESIDGSVVEAIKFYLQAGVAQSDLATAFGLTAVQVKAVATDVDLLNKLMTLNSTVTIASASTLAGLGTVEDEEIRRLKESQAAREALISGTKQPNVAFLDTSFTAFLKQDAEVIRALKETIALREKLRLIGQSPNEVGSFNAGATGLENIGFPNQPLSPAQIAAIAQEAQHARDLKDALEGVSSAFAQMGQIGGAALSGLVKGIGLVLSNLNSASEAVDRFKASSTNLGRFAGAASFVGFGLGIGFAIGSALKSAFESAAVHAAMRQAAKDFGVNISQATAQGILDATKQVARSHDVGVGTAHPHGDVHAFTQAAEALNLPSIISDAGGIDLFGFDKAIAKAHDLFSFLEQGQLTIQQVGKIFNDVFEQLVPDAISQTSKLVSAAFLDLQQTAIRFGTKSPALEAFRKAQTDQVTGGLADFFKNGKVGSQSSATAFGGAFAAQFAELQRQGLSLLDIVKQMAPSIEAFRAQLKKLGFDGGAAFDRILGFADLLKDKVAGPALDSISALQKVLSGLANTGGLDQSIFTGFTDQIGKTFRDLTAKGLDPDKIAQLLAPTLQTLFELQERGFVITDETTKNLLAQAVAQGRVGDQFKSAAERTVDGLNRTNSILEAIANKLGAIVPKLPNPNQSPSPTPRKDEPKGPTPDFPIETLQSFPSGGRVLPFLNQRTVRGHGLIAAEAGELVLNAAQQRNVGAALGGAPQPLIVQLRMPNGSLITELVLNDIHAGNGKAKFNTLVKRAG